LQAVLCCLDLDMIAPNRAQPHTQNGTQAHHHKATL
jgi:hypothetical protein